jgi:hypothetical protein
MASSKPIKVVNEKIKVKPKSVKVVASTPDLHRKALNAMETTRTTVTKSGALAKREAARVEMRNSGTKAKVVRVRGGGVGLFGLPKNK